MHTGAVLVVVEEEEHQQFSPPNVVKNPHVTTKQIDDITNESSTLNVFAPLIPAIAMQCHHNHTSLKQFTALDVSLSGKQTYPLIKKMFNILLKIWLDDQLTSCDLIIIFFG